MINLVLSTEKINDFQTCPLLYHYKHNIRKIPAKKATYFETGELIHYMLQEYYTTKLHIDSISLSLEVIIEKARNYAANNLKITAEELEIVIADFRMYYEHYANSESWVILGVEEPFAKELFTEGEIRVVITGKSDLRIATMRGNGPHAIVDHKYEGRFNEKCERDNQPLCYSWAFGTRDFIYNRIGKQKSKKPEDKLLRPYFSFAQFQINDWVESIKNTAYDILKCYELNTWPMKFSGCNFHGNKCSYYDICNTTPDNREYKLETMFADRGDSKLMESK